MDCYIGKDVVLTIVKKPTFWKSSFEPFFKRVTITSIRGNFIVAKDQTGMERSTPIEDEFTIVTNIEESNV
jgi:hypothetical protein